MWIVIAVFIIGFLYLKYEDRYGGFINYIVPELRPGDSLRAAGIIPMAPTTFLEHRFPELVSELDDGRVTEAVAEKLSAATGCTKQFWLNIQEAYDGNH